MKIVTYSTTLFPLFPFCPPLSTQLNSAIIITIFTLNVITHGHDAAALFPLAADDDDAFASATPFRNGFFILSLYSFPTLHTCNFHFCLRKSRKNSRASHPSTRESWRWRHEFVVERHFAWFSGSTPTHSFQVSWNSFAFHHHHQASEWVCSFLLPRWLGRDRWFVCGDDGGKFVSIFRSPHLALEFFPTGHGDAAVSWQEQFGGRRWMVGSWINFDDNFGERF